jgi:coenzyme PQQ synthesis protein D (PqqD)
MQERRQPLAPRARKEGLVIEELPNEMLVYDLKRDKAHCLNPMAALVWRHCDGETSVAEMVRLLQAELKTSVDEELVWLALDQLEKSFLLQERLTRSLGARLSRREVVRRLGLTAGVTLPLITSILAPTVVEAASCARATMSCATVPCCPGTCVCAPALRVCVGAC